MMGSCLSCLAAVVFAFILKYMRYWVEWTAREWDMNTVTAGDYAVKFDLTKDICEKYLNEPIRSLSAEDNQIECVRYRENLKSAFESQPLNGVTHKVACIDLVFDQEKLMELLEKRDHAVQSHKKAKIDKANKKLNKYIKKKEFQQRAAEPLGAFVTFETGDGHDSWVEKGSITLKKGLARHFGSDLGLSPNSASQPDFLTLAVRDSETTTLKIKQAAEPTNIIWENKHVSNRSRAFRYLVFILCSLLSFTLTFAATFYLKSRDNDGNYEKVNCHDIEGLYTTDQLQNHAFDAW